MKLSLLGDLVIVILAATIVSHVVEVGLELLAFLLLLLDLLLLSQDLVGIGQDVSLLALALGVAVFHVMNDQCTVLAHSEQLVVVVSESHALNRLPVSLNFGQLFKL